jgi:hypothetical protein
MRTLTRTALLAAVAGIVSLAAAMPSDAHWSRYHHYYRHHVWVHHGYGSYAYAPRRFYNAGNQNERDCMRSPASQRYVPCLNRP